MESKKNFCDLPEIDLNIIKNHVWAENMWRRLNVGFQKTFNAWVNVVSQLSNKKEDINVWVKIFEDHYEDTCCELVTDMEQLRSGVVKKIEEALKTIQQHCKTLHIEMPEFGNENLGLLQEYQQLQKRIDEYEVIIKTRRGELDELRRKQFELCQYLGKEPKIIRDEPLPLPEELDRFQKVVEKLEEEKLNRMETFHKIKREILNIIAELKYKPSTKFEESVVNSDDFRVINENMKLLARFHKNLKEQQKDVKEEIAHLWNKIDHLWNILDIALLEREHFKQSNKDTSVKVLESLRKELLKCEDLKKANIKTFVKKLRDELNDLWKKSHCNKEECIEKFGFYASDCYTEDLLELYEVEVEKWKRYYEENKEIIQLLDKHNVLWVKMKELEEMSANPTRFNNRGGQLLKEEKERNMLSKKIPSIEERLLSLANKYEIRYEVPFRTFGLTVLEYFENLHIDRENVKQQKSSARKLHNTPSTSSMKKVTPKRKKTPCTPNDVQKRLKLTPREVATEPKRRQLVIPKVTVPTTTLTKRRSKERMQRLEKRRRSARHLKRKIDESTTTEYGEFQNELSERSSCRSTLDPKATPAFMKSTTPKKLTPQTPSNIKSTPSSCRTPNNKFAVTKSNLKLIF